MRNTRPCLTCGELTNGTRCDNCAPIKAVNDNTTQKPGSYTRGYNQRWRVLSEKARRLQPFCTDCGTTTDLQADHSKEAWRRHNAGLAIRLQDIDVTCGSCNRKRGQTRHNAV